MKCEMKVDGRRCCNNSGPTIDIRGRLYRVCTVHKQMHRRGAELIPFTMGQPSVTYRQQQLMPKPKRVMTTRVAQSLSEARQKLSDARNKNGRG